MLEPGSGQSSKGNEEKVLVRAKGAFKKRLLEEA